MAICLASFDRSACHRSQSDWGPTGAISVGSLRRTSARGLLLARLVVVRDFDFVGIARLPAETHAILLIDPNTVLALARTGKRFEAVARWHCKLAEIAYAVELGQLTPDNGPELLRARRSRTAAIDAIE